MNKEYSWLLWFLPLFFSGATIFLIYFLIFAHKEIPKEKEYKCYSKVFLILWCVFIITFFLGNNFQIYLLKDMPGDESFFGILIIMVVILAFYDSKLDNYLEKNYHEKWKEINVSEGFTNPSRVFEFLYLKDSLNDPIVTKLKRAVIQQHILVLVHFFIMPIVWFKYP